MKYAKGVKSEREHLSRARRGGFARAAKLSPERRSEIARLGGAARSRSRAPHCLLCEKPVKARDLCPMHLRYFYLGRAPFAPGAKTGRVTRVALARRTATAELIAAIGEFRPQDQAAAALMREVVASRRSRAA